MLIRAGSAVGRVPERVGDVADHNAAQQPQPANRRSGSAAGRQTLRGGDTMRRSVTRPGPASAAGLRRTCVPGGGGPAACAGPSNRASPGCTDGVQTPELPHTCSLSLVNTD